MIISSVYGGEWQFGSDFAELRIMWRLFNAAVYEFFLKLYFLVFICPVKVILF